MGWSYGGPNRSALQFENLAREVARVLPAGSLRRAAQSMFDRVQRADGPFSFSPREAHGIGVALLAAGTSPRMPVDWGKFALDIADAADAAANSNRPWRWS